MVIQSRPQPAPGRAGGYVADLADYDAEIGQAVAIIRGRLDQPGPGPDAHGPFHRRPGCCLVGQPESRNSSHLILNSRGWRCTGAHLSATRP